MSEIEPLSLMGEFKMPAAIRKLSKDHSPTEISTESQEEKKNETSQNRNSSKEPVPKPSVTPPAPPLPYGPPPWAAEPPAGMGYKLEVVKTGTIIDTIDLDKRRNQTFVVVGRLPTCDIVLDHPSISRYHCILQYGEDTLTKSGKGWHIFELGSTHGSKMNKNHLPVKQFVRIHVGFVIQLGGSSRLLTLTGPDDDAEPEWDCSPTEMKERVQKRVLEAKLAAAARKEIEDEKRRETENESEGINWGMDYGEEMWFAPVIELEGHLAEEGEAYYNTDPKKALSKFFEREGFEMKFDYAETGHGHTHKWICSIELPIEVDGIDRAVTAQATVSTSKKDGMIQCALEACKILDRHGVLRRGISKARIKKKTLEENDYYDEDDDLYFDRTGQLEKQREKRKQWAEHGGKTVVETDTYETLSAKLEETKRELADVQQQLDRLGPVKSLSTDNESSNLEEYCKTLAQGGAGGKDDLKTKTQKSQLRQQLVALTHEAQKLEKLVKIAKPVALPQLKTASGAAIGKDKQSFLRKMMMVSRQKRNDDGNSEQPVANESKIAQTEKLPKGPSIPSGVVLKKEMPQAPSIPPSEQIEKKKSNDETSMDLEQETAASTDSDISNQTAESSTNVASTSSEEEPNSSNIDAKDLEGHKPTRSFYSTPMEIDSKEQEEPETPPIPIKRTVEETEGDDGDDEPKKKRHRIRHRERPAKPEEYGIGCDTRDEQYATWLPPENQSGDGKTKLHEKFAGRY